MPDVPKHVPIYIGPNEADASLFLNMFAQGTNNRLLAGQPPLKEFQIPKDPDGKLEGVIDVFGDGSFFAILTPGHTVGHLSFLARTTTGPSSWPPTCPTRVGAGTTASSQAPTCGTANAATTTWSC